MDCETKTTLRFSTGISPSGSVSSVITTSEPSKLVPIVVTSSHSGNSAASESSPTRVSA